MPPTAKKVLSKFIGIVKYYHNMWYSRSHTLHPLTLLKYNKVKFNWADV